MQLVKKKKLWSKQNAREKGSHTIEDRTKQCFQHRRAPLFQWHWFWRNGSTSWVVQWFQDWTKTTECNGVTHSTLWIRHQATNWRLSYRAAAAIATALAAAASSAFLVLRSDCNCWSMTALARFSSASFRSIDATDALSCCRPVTRLWSLKNE